MLLREHISEAVVNLVFDDEDPASFLIDTFDAETMAGRNQSITHSASQAPAAGYRASYRIKIQRGGRVAGASLTSNTPTLMGPSGQVTQQMGQAADAKYLDPRMTPGPGWLEIAMLLRRIKGSITVNKGQLTAQLISRPVDEVAGDYLVDSVARLRSYGVNAFWGDGSASLGQAAASITVNEVGGTVTPVSVNGSGTFAKFQPGDLLQVGSDHATLRVLRTGAGASGASGYVRVVKVDRINRQLHVQSEPGVGAVSVTSTDHFHYADTYDFVNGHAAAYHVAPEGVESLLTGTGTFPGTPYDVNDVPELIAFVEDVSATPEDPTPESFAKILDTIADGGYAPPAALIAERSLWSLYAQLERESGAQYVVPQGSQFQASGGIDAPNIGHMGTRFERFNSTRIRTQTVVGLAPEEWMKFIPMGDKTVHWHYGNGPLAGVQSIFGPTFSGYQATELADAPFDSYLQFGCKVPGRQFRKTGYKTLRTV